MKKLYPINTIVAIIQKTDELFEKPLLMTEAKALVATILMSEPKLFSHVCGCSLNDVSQEEELGRLVLNFISKHPRSSDEWINWLKRVLLDVSGYQHFLKSVYVTRLNNTEIVEAWVKSSVMHFDAFAKNETTLFKDFSCDPNIDKEKWAICEDVEPKQFIDCYGVEMLLKICNVVEKHLEGYAIEWIDYDNCEICLSTAEGFLIEPLSFSDISHYEILKDEEKVGEAVVFDKDENMVIY